VCVTVMNWINYGVWYITNDFVIYILHVLTNAVSSWGYVWRHLQLMLRELVMRVDRKGYIEIKHKEQNRWELNWRDTE